MTEDRIEARMRFFSWLALVGAAFVVLLSIAAVATLAFLSVRVFQASERVRALADNNRDVFCALRADEQRSHDRAAEFLRNNPEGFVGQGGMVILSPQEIRNDIQESEQVLAIMSRLECGGA